MKTKDNSKLLTKKDFEEIISIWNAVQIESLKRLDKLVEEGIVERIIPKETMKEILSTK